MGPQLSHAFRGGWFVLEVGYPSYQVPAWKYLLNKTQPWITPSIFENTGNDDVIDEYTFGHMQDERTALNVLENHWQTWIVEDDFRQMKAVGLNHVRYARFLSWP